MAKYNTMELTWHQSKPQWFAFVTDWNKSGYSQPARNISQRNKKISFKNFESYNYIYNTRLGASLGVSILIRNDIPESKINLNTNQQTIAAKATLHWTINICYLYIPPQVTQSAGAAEYTNCISAEG